MRRVLVSLLLAAALATSCTPSIRETATPTPAPSIPIVIWSSRDLPPGLAENVAVIGGVRSVSAASAAVVNLVSVQGAAKPPPQRRKGGILPLSITAVDPPAGATDPLNRALAAGEAVLTEASAALRRMGEGDSLRIEGANGVRRTFRIGAVVSDAAGRGRELIVPANLAGDLGMTAPRELITMVAENRKDEVLQAMETATAGMRTRIHVGEDPVINPDEGPILSFVELKKIFGEFTYRPRKGRFLTQEKAWTDANIVESRVPLLGVIKCNRRLLPQLTGAMLELKRLGLTKLVRTNQGCWSPRMQVGNTFDVSRHAFGIAVDINAPANPYGEAPHQDRRLIEVMERWGFMWGGRWLVPDGMHFEFVRFVKRA